MLRRGLDVNRENSEASLLTRVLVAIDEVWNYQLSSAKTSSRENGKMSGLDVDGSGPVRPE